MLLLINVCPHFLQEELAEGLHLIDFEQLKIENQTYNEKIEERNEVGWNKINYCGTPPPHPTPPPQMSTSKNGKQGTVCKSSAHNATDSEIGVILSPLHDAQIQLNQLNFMQPVAGTKCCRATEFFHKTGMSHEENCRFNMSPFHVPQRVS